MKEIVFLDIEAANNKPTDIGAVKSTGEVLHTESLESLDAFLQGENTICGHNIFNHDLRYINNYVEKNNIRQFIDTLYWSPLLFPKKPYHKLVKDDKLCSDEVNNPLNDAKKARDLFNDEVTAFNELDRDLREIYYGLLANRKEFADFSIIASPAATRALTRNPPSKSKYAKRSFAIFQTKYAAMPRLPQSSVSIP